MRWGGQSTDGEEPEEVLEMAEGEDNVESDNNPSLYYAMNGNFNVVPQI